MADSAVTSNNPADGGVVRVPLWKRLASAAVTNLRGWPPVTCDFTKGKWGWYCWELEKAVLKASDLAKGSDEVRYLQSVLNRYNQETLPVDGFYGPQTRAAVERFQAGFKLKVDAIVGPQTWDIVDWLAFKSYWRQYKGKRVNPHSGLPADNHGLTRETSFIECLIRANFPELRLSRNWMVDRNIRGGKTLSPHAFGNALDLMFGKNVIQGTRVAEWIGWYETRLGLRQVIYNTRICEKGTWRKLLPKSLQHYDHVHITCNSGERPLT